MANWPSCPTLSTEVRPSGSARLRLPPYCHRGGLNFNGVGDLDGSPGCLDGFPAPDPRKISHFCLAKGALVPSLPVPCQESEEKQKHGKPLPSVSKSLGQGKFFVGNKGLATCCKARTASASVVLGKLLSSPMLTFATSERIFLSPIAKKPGYDIRPRPRIGRPLHSLIPRGRHEQSRLWKDMKTTVCSN